VGTQRFEGRPLSRFDRKVGTQEPLVESGESGEAEVGDAALHVFLGVFRLADL
jgi:hypothetical protein